MIVVIEPHNTAEYSNLMDEMFRLRARVFRDRLGWDVRVADGQERDKYDDEGPVYLIYADDEGRKVKGCLRLLPTTGPTVLAALRLSSVEFFEDRTRGTTGDCAPNAFGSASVRFATAVADSNPTLPAGG